MAIRTVVWGENIHEQTNEVVAGIYPEGMHETIADGIREKLGENALVRTATLDQPEHGLTAEVLAETDVLTWWGHMGHHLVDDDLRKKRRGQRNELDHQAGKQHIAPDCLMTQQHRREPGFRRLQGDR